MCHLPTRDGRLTCTRRQLTQRQLLTCSLSKVLAFGLLGRLWTNLETCLCKRDVGHQLLSIFSTQGPEAPGKQHRPRRSKRSPRPPLLTQGEKFLLDSPRALSPPALPPLSHTEEFEGPKCLCAFPIPIWLRAHTGLETKWGRGLKPPNKTPTSSPRRQHWVLDDSPFLLHCQLFKPGLRDKPGTDYRGCWR